MSSTVRTILIIAVFVLITIWLFRQPRVDMAGAADVDSASNGKGSTESEDVNEGYDNSVTDHNVEPTDNIHSYGVRFMPHLTDRDEALTNSDRDSFRVMDHTDYQRDGSKFSYKADVPHQPKYKDAGQQIRDVTPDTTLQATYGHGDRVHDSNDINGVCSNDTLLENDGYAYSNEIHEVTDIDMSRDEHHSLIAMRPHMKTYIEIDESAGQYETPAKKQTLEYEELKDTVNRYRNDTLRSIRNGNEHNASMRSKYPFYDGVH